MKKMTLKILAVLTSLVCLSGCGSRAIIETDPTAAAPIKETVAAPAPLEPATSANTDVKTQTGSLLETNISLVDNTSHNFPGQNVMISGISLNFALAMLGNGTSPEATAQIEQFLGMDIQSANAYYAQFLNRKDSGTRNKLSICNSFWVKDELTYPVRDSYINQLEGTYKAEVSYVPMNEEGIRQINAWADKATDGLIKQALSPSDLTPYTMSILVNAVLLDGKWQRPFCSDKTRDITFQLDDQNSKTVSGMYSEEYFYYENDYATAFRKDYDNSEFYMVGILPKNTGEFDLSDLDIPGLLASGKNVSELNAELYIMLPKLDFEKKFNLTTILQDMGLTQIFDDSRNNLPLVYDSNSPDFTSWASAIIQNDRLIVDEDGTKAAAVTSVIMNCADSISNKTYLYVYLNRPFAILLMDGATDEPLFIAKIMEP